MKPVRVLAALLAVIALAGSLSLTVVRAVSPDNQKAVLMTAFVPVAVLGYLVVIALVLLFLRHVRGVMPVLLGIAVLGLVLHGIWLAPSYLGQHSGGSPDLIVLELNELHGTADPSSAARVIKQQNPDLVVLTEATAPSVQGLAGQGVGGGHGRWRYQGGDPESGVVVLSSYPLGAQQAMPLSGGGWVMKVQAARPFTLIAGHPAQEIIAFQRWRQDLRTLDEVSRRVQGPRMVMGDLNSTVDHSELQRVLATGLHDAAQQANSGWQPTWPSRGSTAFHGIPVLIGLFAIDHVLLSDDFSAVNTRTYRVRRTDHDALVAAVREVG